MMQWKKWQLENGYAFRNHDAVEEMAVGKWVRFPARFYGHCIAATARAPQKRFQRGSDKSVAQAKENSSLLLHRQFDIFDNVAAERVIMALENWTTT